ncbi:hypothetical protein [Streptomyces sp. NPDC007355]|uniref:hypothetical protein n=1 Tax=Streptomyces sp. NPDC007355 TaxID=3364778 RepID=UPI0036A4BA23
MPDDTGPEDARAAVAALVTELARDFHGTDVEVRWEPPEELWSCTVAVTPTDEPTTS